MPEVSAYVYCSSCFNIDSVIRHDKSFTYGSYEDEAESRTSLVESKTQASVHPMPKAEVLSKIGTARDHGV